MKACHGRIMEEELSKASSRHEEHRDHPFPRDEGEACRRHNLASEAVPNWDLPTLAGARAARSTVNDLLTFLEMALSIKQTPHRTRLPRGWCAGCPWGILENLPCLRQSYSRCLWTLCQPGSGQPRCTAL